MVVMVARCHAGVSRLARSLPRV
ncbi:unnamed protein product [Ectocarpus sp. CCAP 1310/34]|nr:unnamed protein product [Ectocarpus sp. CCAP 1310/34]